MAVVLSLNSFAALITTYAGLVMRSCAFWEKAPGGHVVYGVIRDQVEPTANPAMSAMPRKRK